jgi:flagellar biosynthesis/type III secretory pathway protein FliH
MSTSYKSLFPSSSNPVETFPYPDAQGNAGIAHPAPQAVEGRDEVGELLLRAHAEGVREGEEKERARITKLVEQERAKITETILKFQTSVSEYFSRTELEVVQFALAIAAKILHHEAQADPQLLAKLAKSVVESLHQNTTVKIRVAPEQAEAWRNGLAAHQDGKTKLGTTNLGIDAQLRELESGLFDLMAETPEPQ